ncbi:aldehyde dehydrogenase [Paraburkholderia phytofirmans]|uniref:aldehyde dehydrogenase n=1 Tax=Paraburkholderia phytofirmans TaxID=261302 RepID=UPI0038B6DB16
MTIASYRELFDIRHPESFYINGRWVPASGSTRLDVVFPATERVVASVPEATREEIDAAVAAARAAFDGGVWRRLHPQERGAKLRQLAQLLKDRASVFSDSWTLEMGGPKMLTGPGGMSPFAIFEYYGQLVENAAFEDVRPRAGGAVGIVTREPVGVVAAITPWNAPVSLSCKIVAPALAAGCSVVLKPAPETPLFSWILAECMEEAGIPAGVFNFVPAGREVGDWLVRNPMVDKVSLIGSSAAGKYMMGVCSDRLARVSLELGGKSAAIVLEDADPAAVVPNLVPHFTALSGQMCAALTRIIVPRSRKAEYEEAIRAALEALKVGDPFDPTTFVGPLAMRRQHEKVMSYIERGQHDGARIVTGGRRPEGLNVGYYVAPTLFSDVDNRMVIAQEEIFGPVGCLIAHDGEADAIRLANDSNYGLHGAVFTPDAERAYRIIREMRTGSVTHNGWIIDSTLPFGGFKQSGIGRDGGPEGLSNYQELKTVYMSSVPANLSNWASSAEIA